MKIPKPKKASRKALVRLCDKELSLSVREETPFCVLCGSRENLTCGHLFSRVAYSTRWLRENVATQCAGCNLRHEHNPHPFVAWYIRKYSLERYESLLQHHASAFKMSNAQLAELLDSIRARRAAFAKKNTLEAM